MRNFCTILTAASLAFLAVPFAVQAQTSDKPDLGKVPTLYVVGYAHLDTEWRWEYPQVINEYIRKTMEDNFKLFEKVTVQVPPGDKNLDIVQILIHC